jgi:hypothetical protein
MYEDASEAVSGTLPDEVVPIAEHIFRWSEGRFYSRLRAPDIDTTQDSYDFVAGEGRAFAERLRAGSFGRGRYNPARADWLWHQLKAPGPSDDSDGEWMSDLGAILSNDATTLRPSWEDVDGRRSAVIDVNVLGVHVLAVWLDIERSSVPVRWEKYGHDGLLASVELRNYVLLSESAWQPLEIEVTFHGDHAAAGMRRIQRVLVDAAGSPGIRVNSRLGPEDLIVQFPRGSIVYDEDTHESMIMAAKAEGLMESSTRLAEAVRERSPSANMERPVITTRKFEIKTALLVVGVGLLCGSALRLWRR